MIGCVANGSILGDEVGSSIIDRAPRRGHLFSRRDSSTASAASVSKRRW